MNNQMDEEEVQNRRDILDITVKLKIGEIGKMGQLF